MAEGVVLRAGQHRALDTSKLGDHRFANSKPAMLNCRATGPKSALLDWKDLGQQLCGTRRKAVQTSSRHCVFFFCPLSFLPALWMMGRDSLLILDNCIYHPETYKGRAS
mmetsp:Transcript_54125/g.95055  ORF Transcript_54125/g.95055 Transcript_54125/m.95055 type:complete len:109 (+) Transcript_54125:307-633(+)